MKKLLILFTFLSLTFILYGDNYKELKSNPSLKITKLKNKTVYDISFDNFEYLNLYSIKLVNYKMVRDRVDNILMLDKNNKVEGHSSLKISGHKDSTYIEFIKGKIPSGTKKINVSYWTKSENIPYIKAIYKACRTSFHLMTNDESHKRHYSCHLSTSNWQKTGMSFNLSNISPEYFIFGLHNLNIGNLWFDNMRIEFLK